MKWTAPALACVAAVLLTQAPPAPAKAAEEFYQGKTLSIYLAGGVGGPYDIRARTLEPYLRKYLPGSPTIIVQALPGAGGQRAANNLYNILPKDGTALGLLLPTIAFNQAVHAPGIKYDARKFHYIGSMDPLDQAVVVSKTAPARTLADVRRTEVTLGSSGRGSSSWIVPSLMNRYLGTKFKIVTGYPGAPEILLAIERGEIGGIAVNWYSIAASRPDWQPGKAVFGLAQSGLKRIPELPDVPTLIELAETQVQRDVLEFYGLSTALGVALVAPPDVPAQRVSELRSAMDKAISDPAFLADARARELSIHPSSGHELESIVERTLATPADTVSRMQDVLNEN